MLFRSRRTIRFAPGVRLNIGKDGLFATIDRRATIILPGIDVSYVASIARRRRRRQGLTSALRIGCMAIVLASIWWMGWL